MFRKLKEKQRPRGHSPLRLLVVLVVTVFSIESAVMVALDKLPELPLWQSQMLDASLLVSLLFPVFYFLVFRPMRRDMQELTELEAVRRADEASLRAILDNSPYRAWLKDVQGRFLAANEQLARSCGFRDPAELVGKTNHDIWPEALADKYCAEDQAVMALRKQRHIEEMVVVHGEERWFGTFRTPILDVNGQVLGTTGFSRDITERKWAEEQLRLTAKIFESSHDAIIITDAFANIISVNPAFTEITGYPSEEVVGKNPRILNSGRQSKEFYADMWKCIGTLGYWSGEVWNRRKDGSIYAGRLSINALRGENGKISHYIGATSDITEYKEAQERIHDLAYYDQLTGLPNRTLLRDRVNQLVASAQREKTEFAVMFIDLDNFKNVNDSLGHHAGDMLLQNVAQRLRSCVREVDTVSRLGGDEFVVVLPEVGRDGAQQVARKIIGQVASSFQIGAHDITVTTSLGVSIYPSDAADLDALLKHADTALYQAKAKGKNDFALFTEEMKSAAYERMTLENELRRALANEELVLYYQPQIQLASGRLAGMEALLRWPHRRFGMIAPDQFIAIADECGLMLELGEWVMHEACRQSRQWQQAGLPAIPVAVNVTARQLQSSIFLEMVESVLRHTRLEPQFLELELTEHAVMADVASSIAVMRQVGALGVKFAIDDFGTGYSSLAYLKQLPIDKVKIDKSFVQDLSSGGGSQIARAISVLAHSLGLSVVAEGVETQMQLDVLAEQGCDSVQGYYFSKPLPPHEFAALLRVARGA